MSLIAQAELFDDTAKADAVYLSPVREITSYEALWERFKTAKRISALFTKFDFALPSRIATEIGIQAVELLRIKNRLQSLYSFTSYAALFNRDFEYPARLREAEYPAEILYYQGVVELLSTPSVSIVGARKASEQGLKRAAQLSKALVGEGYTVMSGLAEGIDTAAHTAALEHKGRTIAVLGTPINEFYPKFNRNLQLAIAKDHLVVSQVPFVAQDWFIKSKANFFPERNKTMSALSIATVIVEASDSSGSLIQARAAIHQGRKLFILKSCFERGLKWPEKYLRLGAIKIEADDEIIEALKS
jgi:DNA processing protein